VPCEIRHDPTRNRALIAQSSRLLRSQIRDDEFKIANVIDR